MLLVDEVDMTGHVGDIHDDTIDDTYEYSIVAESDSAEEILCPSYCDNSGEKRDRKYCLNWAYCCVGNGLLECCNNESLQIDSGVKDNFNCSESP